MTTQTASPGRIHRPRATVRPDKVARRTLTYVLVLLFCLATIFPVYWMVLSAIQPVNYSLQYPPPFFPQAFTLQPFADLFAKNPVGSWILNSVLRAVLTTILCLSMTIFGAYAMSAMRWRGKGLFGWLLLFTQMLPEALVIIPVYAMYQRLGMTEKIPPLALIDTAFVLPLGVWILKNTFDTIPPELSDAAMVDGCTRVGTLFRILLPIAAPGLVAVAVVAFFYSWNEFLFASSMITNKDYWPATVGLASLKSMIDTPIDRMLAAGLLFSVLPVIFYLLVQRYVVAGLSAGAVKG